jgi:hypothetical protein
MLANRNVKKNIKLPPFKYYLHFKLTCLAMVGIQEPNHVLDYMQGGMHAKQPFLLFLTDPFKNISVEKQLFLLGSPFK